MEPYVVNQSKGRAIGLAVLCLLFTLAGVWMLGSDDFLTVIFGVASIGFFGVGGGYALFKMFRQGATLTADERGIHPGNGGFVPWEHVGHIAATKTGGGASALGIQISDVPAYLASLTPEQRRQTWEWVRGITTAIRPLAAASGTPSPELEQLKGAEDLEQMMAWTREVSGGYDLTFAAMTLGKSVDRTADELTDYRDRVMERRQRG